MKPGKRRALPVEPTQTTASTATSSNPTLPLHVHDPRAYSNPPEYQQTLPPAGPVYSNPGTSLTRQVHDYQSRESSMEPEMQYDSHAGMTTMTLAASPNQHQLDYYQPDGTPDGEAYSPNELLDMYQAPTEFEPLTQSQSNGSYQPRARDPRKQQSHPIPGSVSPHTPPHSSRQSGSGGGHVMHDVPTLPHSHSAPLIAQDYTSPSNHGRPASQQAYSERDTSSYGMSPTRISGFAQTSPSPLRYSQEATYNCGGSVLQPTSEDEMTLPPLPPMHRSKANQLSVVEDSGRIEFDASQLPAPLNHSSPRGSVSPASYNANQDQNGYTPSISPSSGRGLFRTSPSPSRTSYTQQGRRRSEEPSTASVRDDSFGLPPSLVPGYDPAVAAEISRRMSKENRASWGRQVEPSPQAPGKPSPRQFRQSHSHQDLQSMASYRGDDVFGRSSHQSPAPMIKPRAASPHWQVPRRKSVSPQPSAGSGGTSLSGVPFSPDAYDALNPNIGSASVSEASEYQPVDYNRDRGRDLPREPIRGNDGRIIDPSDHLPTATWAPEPDRNSPTTASLRAGRPSPQGAQPMPSSTRRPIRDSPIRPLSMNTPMYINSGDAETPLGSPRNRLQKKPRSQASSPALVGSSPAGSQGSSQGTPRSTGRNSVAEYALREHENYGQGRTMMGSPYGSGARNSPAAAPPVPAKVPMRTGQEDYSALSEELRSIDIGSGNRRATRRAQY